MLFFFFWSTNNFNSSELCFPSCKDVSAARGSYSPPTTFSRFASLCARSHAAAARWLALTAFDLAAVARLYSCAAKVRTGYGSVSLRRK